LENNGDDDGKAMISRVFCAAIGALSARISTGFAN
jgi:hypothetical protein